jgi:phosphonate transport system substrate-binding protein
MGMSDKKYCLIRIILSVCVLFLFMAGCRDRQQDAPEAADSNSGKEFYVGILPEQNIFSQRERYEPLAEYLSKKLDIKVVLRIAGSYQNIIDSLQAGKLDAAFLGSFAGAVALKKLEAQPLARMEYEDGSSTYRGLIFVRKDSGIATAQDMKGKTFVFVDKTTTAGWLLPLHYFKENGIDDPFSWLGDTYFAGTHEDAILDVVNNKANIGAAKDTIFYRLAESDSRILQQLEKLASSPRVPENALLVRPEIEESVKTAVRDTLLSMHQDKRGQQVLEKFGAAKFIETTAQDYSPVIAYADDIGIDITKGVSKDMSGKE